MSVNTSIIAVTTRGGSESQTLVGCGTNQLLYSNQNNTLPTWTPCPFSATADGFEYIGNLSGSTPTMGSLGERVEVNISQAASVSLTTDTPVDICSISLTPGIWEATGVVVVTGIVTGSLLDASISLTSSTQGTLGANQLQIGLLNISSAQSIVVPSWRVELTESTSIYLVANCSFSLGTVNGFGRLSATRVG